MTVLGLVFTILNQCKKAKIRQSNNIMKVRCYGDNLLGYQSPDTRNTSEQFAFNKNLQEKKDFDTKQEAGKNQPQEIKVLLKESTKLQSLTAKKSDITTKKTETTFDKVLQAFDVYERLPSLVESKRVNAESGAFDLVRCISMCWVILAHQFSERLSQTADILVLIPTIRSEKHNWNNTLVQLGFYAVDFFLFMGGYVAIISLQRTVDMFKTSAKWKLPILYLFLLVKRYIRVLPIIALVVLYRIYVYPWLSPENPTNHYFIDYSTHVDQTSWQDWSLVYAYDKTSTGMQAGWLWYLVVDYQCFMVVPFILMVNWIHKFVALGVCSILISSSLIYTGFMMFEK